MTINPETETVNEPDFSVLRERAEALVELRDRFLIAETAYMDEAVRLYYKEGAKIGAIAKDGPIAYPTLRARILKIPQE